MTAPDALSSLRGVAACTAADLRAAVPAGELQLHYQPILDLSTRAPAAVEALLRWVRPEGTLAPGSFWHVVDRATARMIGAHVLDTACAQIAQWRAADLVPQVSVNVDPRELDAAWVAGVYDALGRHGLPPEALTLELTETAQIDNRGAPDLAAALVRRGVGIALDDAGTGFNALAAVADMPVTELKIDRRFVTRLGEPRTDALIRAFVALAGDIGMRTVAEGVETEQQAQLLDAHGVDRAQGFLFSRPMPAPAVAAYWSDALCPEQRGLRLIRGLAGAGTSPVTIAAILNRRGIPGRNARQWRAATVLAELARGSVETAPRLRHAL